MMKIKLLMLIFCRHHRI